MATAGREGNTRRKPSLNYWTPPVAGCTDTICTSAIPAMSYQRSRILPRATIFASIAVATSCGGGPFGGPDALRPETFEATLVNGQTLPVRAYQLPFGAWVSITSARLKSIVAGRTVDPRIFDDRSGNGTTGGGSRDSATASAQMADIRAFDEGGVGQHTDTSSVNVERRGDLLILTRTGAVAVQTVVDTAHFVEGKLVVIVHEWERYGTKANNAQIIYSIVK